MGIQISRPSNFPIRPIVGGMVRDMPPTTLPSGTFTKVANYRVDTAGLLRRGGFTPFNLDTENQQWGRPEHLIYFYKKNAGTDMILLTDRGAYNTTGANSAVRYFTNTPVTIVASTAALAGTNSIITCSMDLANYNLLRKGSDLYDDTNTTRYGTLYSDGIYSSGTFDMSLRVDADVVLDELVSTTHQFTLSFYTEDSFGVSYAVLPYTEANTSSDEKMMLADQSRRGILQISSGVMSTVELYEDITREDPSFLVSAHGVAYFKDRLWAFGCTEVDTHYTQRIRWSVPTNYDVFQAEDYVDLPYSEGPIIAVVPLGSMIVAYATDAVYIGRQTNKIDHPFEFEKLETGNTGLVNQNAVAPWIDGHFFVGQDNVYFLSASNGLQEIGPAVLTDTLGNTVSKQLTNFIKVKHDPDTNSMVFYFPEFKPINGESETGSTRLWRWYYRTKAWAYDEAPYFEYGVSPDPEYYFNSIVASRLFSFEDSWQDFLDDDPDAEWVRSGTTPEEARTFSDYNSWNEVSTRETKFKKLYISVYHSPFYESILLQEDLEATQDRLGTADYPVRSEIESGDYDLDLPNFTKTFTQFSAKTTQNLNDTPVTPSTLAFNVSGDCGYTWKRRASQLRFRNNYNEGKVDFRSHGSTLRFNLTGNTVEPPYKLSEFVIQAVGIGNQVTT